MERFRTQYKCTVICVHEGDIAEVDAEALITAINSSGLWLEKIDDTIRRYAGTVFHNKARDTMPLKDGQTVVTRRIFEHSGGWGDVVFVVDNLKSPLSQIVCSALIAAQNAGYQTVSLPAIRTGKTLGAVEKDAETTVIELLKAVRNFLDTTPNVTIKEIHFVVFGDQIVLSLLTNTAITSI